VLDRCHVDWLPSHPLPRAWKVAAATCVAVVGSLAADASLVWFGTHLFPSTTGYVHFRFSDYARLTVIGVLIACAGWPVVARVTSTPRWLFFRAALLVTLVLWSPDLYLLVRHQPPKAVAVLMLMHLAIAVVTYSALVSVAPAPDRGPARRQADAGRPTLGARWFLHRGRLGEAGAVAAPGDARLAGAPHELETSVTP
jgi:hypothetical protein